MQNHAAEDDDRNKPSGCYAEDPAAAALIAAQNDAVRKAAHKGLMLPGGLIITEWKGRQVFGRLIITSGLLAEFTREGLTSVLDQVRDFKAFTGANDPYGEHDYAAMDVTANYEDHNGAQRTAQGRINWKIDYYDPSLEEGSDDPADPAKTVRVLTVMSLMDA